MFKFALNFVIGLSLVATMYCALAAIYAFALACIEVWKQRRQIPVDIALDLW